MEKLYIKNFGGIDEAEFEFKPITVLIGPQASGKSVVLKLLYFFRTAFTEFAIKPPIDDDLKIKHIVEKYESRFLAVFPKSSYPKSESAVRYENSKVKVELFIQQYELDFVFDSYTQRVFDDTIKDRDSAYNLYKRSGKGLVVSYFDYATKFAIHPNQQIYIPAKRSLYADLLDNAFIFMKEHVEFDLFTVEFGQLLSHIRKRFQRGEASNFLNPDGNFESKAKAILGGELADSGQEVFLSHWDGRRVPLQLASSGQQEFVPLIMTLYAYFTQSMISDNTTFYVEEPEAHLFPLSQKMVVELLVAFKVQLHRKNRFLITTHSPYILSSFNNLLKAGQIANQFKDQPDKLDALRKVVFEEEWLKPEDFIAYALENGGAEPIMDKETGLIDAAVLDKASETIGDDFTKLLDLQYD